MERRLIRKSPNSGPAAIVLLAFFGPFAILAIDQHFQAFEMLENPGFALLAVGALAGLVIGFALARKFAAKLPADAHLTKVGRVVFVLLYALYGVGAASAAYRHSATLAMQPASLGEQVFVIHGASRLTSRNWERKLYLVGPDSDWDRVVQSTSRKLHERYLTETNKDRDCIQLEVLQGRFGLKFVRKNPVFEEAILPGCSSGRE